MEHCQKPVSQDTKAQVSQEKKIMPFGVINLAQNQPRVQIQFVITAQPGTMHCHITLSRTVRLTILSDECQPGKASAMACATAELSLMLAMMRPPGLNRCPSCFQISTCVTGKRVGNRVAYTYRDIGQHSRQHRRQQSHNRVGKTGNASNNYRSDCALQVNTLDKCHVDVQTDCLVKITSWNPAWRAVQCRTLHIWRQLAIL